MLSRRKFLETHVAGLALPLAVSHPRSADRERQSALPQSTRAGSSFPSQPAKRDYWNDWPLYLTAKVNEARARRLANLESVHNQADVEERIMMIRLRVWEIIGGPLAKTSLNPKVVGGIERKGYRIEKVIFESQPKVYVTAHLYVPTAGQPPFPGILAPLGHTPNGKAYRNYQYLYQTLARKGYMVLAFDPLGQGERVQYLDPRTGRSRFGPTGEHSQAGRQMLLLGATFAQYRVWDGIRALEYLLSRPEVDPKRIGCTGQSGGGTMTMYLCALEPRIQAAVEVQGNSENFAGPNFDPPGAVADAEQNLAGGMLVGIDRGDLLWAFAPKPLLVCYTPLDAGTTYSPAYSEGTQEVFQELQSVYGLLGARGNVELFASPLPHDLDFFTRRATYAWFNRWLGKVGWGTDEDEFDAAPPEVLNCTPTGQVLTSLGGRSVIQVIRDRSRTIVPAIPYADPAREFRAVRQHVRNILHRLLAVPGERPPLQRTVLSSNTGQGKTIEEFEFHSESQVRIPGWFIKPAGKAGPLPTVVCISQRGRDGAVEEPGEMEALVRGGFAICAIDLRGLGITTPRYPAAGPIFYGYDDPDVRDGNAWACLILGKPVLGQQVWDFFRCLDYLETRPDVDRTQIRVLGVGEAGCVALMGTAMDDRPRAVFLDSPLATFRSVVEAEEYSVNLSQLIYGFLRDFDLPDLLTALAPRPCWMLNARGARKETLNESTLQAKYKIAIDFYGKLSAKDALRFLVRSEEERPRALLSWLKSS